MLKYSFERCLCQESRRCASITTTYPVCWMRSMVSLDFIIITYANHLFFVSPFLSLCCQYSRTMRWVSPILKSKIWETGRIYCIARIASKSIITHWLLNVLELWPHQTTFADIIWTDLSIHFLKLAQRIPADPSCMQNTSSCPLAEDAEFPTANWTELTLNFLSLFP